MFSTSSVSTSPCIPLPDDTDLVLRDDVGGKGRGVFAARPFHAEERVLIFRGEVRDVSTFTDLTHALQVGPTAYISSSGQIDDYVNHSCDPNTGVREKAGCVELFALEPIAAGDEITFDYSTTQDGQHWTITCQCGADNCRGTIGDFRDLPTERQRFYIRKGAILPFLISKA